MAASDLERQADFLEAGLAPRGPGDRRRRSAGKNPFEQAARRPASRSTSTDTVPPISLLPRPRTVIGCFFGPSPASSVFLGGRGTNARARPTATDRASTPFSANLPATRWARARSMLSPPTSMWLPTAIRRSTSSPASSVDADQREDRSFRRRRRRPAACRRPSVACRQRSPVGQPGVDGRLRLFEQDQILRATRPPAPLRASARGRAASNDAGTVSTTCCSAIGASGTARSRRRPVLQIALRGGRPAKSSDISAARSRARSADADRPGYVPASSWPRPRSDQVFRRLRCRATPRRPRILACCSMAIPDLVRRPALRYRNEGSDVELLHVGCDVLWDGEHFDSGTIRRKRSIRQHAVGRSQVDTDNEFGHDYKTTEAQRRGEASKQSSVGVTEWRFAALVSTAVVFYGLRHTSSLCRRVSVVYRIHLTSTSTGAISATSLRRRPIRPARTLSPANRDAPASREKAPHRPRCPPGGTVRRRSRKAPQWQPHRPGSQAA